MKTIPNKRKKIENLLDVIKKSVQKGNFKFSNHALERKSQRAIELSDILYVLKNGFHETTKDTWDEEFKAWNYSIRGKSVDNKSLRIVVSFERSGMLIITVIRLKV